MSSQPNDAHWQRPGESPEPIPGRPASARLVDPEDDLTPVGYPGDFGTTTVIPYSDSAASGGPAAGGYHLLDQQEPLPYVHPQSAAQAAQRTLRRQQRSRAAHEAWLARQTAPVIRLDSAHPVEILVQKVIARLAGDNRS